MNAEDFLKKVEERINAKSYVDRSLGSGDPRLVEVEDVMQILKEELGEDVDSD